MYMCVYPIQQMCIFIIQKVESEKMYDDCNCFHENDNDDDEEEE